MKRQTRLTILVVLLVVGMLVVAVDPVVVALDAVIAESGEYLLSADSGINEIDLDSIDIGWEGGSTVDAAGGRVEVR